MLERISEPSNLIHESINDLNNKSYSNLSNNSTFYREIEEESDLKYKIKEIKAKKSVKGLTSLYINREYRKILANSMSNTQYIYDATFMDKYPPIELKGHMSSYFVKSVLSPRCEFVLSGSMDSSIYIWDLNYTSEPIKLTGFHKPDVNAVDWSRNRENFIASASDCGLILLWDDK